MGVSSALTFNALVRFDKEYNLWVAHCLELDLVATGDNPKQARDDLQDLIVTQVSCAIANDNMAYLLRPAPREVWIEYLKAKTAIENVKAVVTSQTAAKRRSQAFQASIPAVLPLSSVDNGAVCYA